MYIPDHKPALAMTVSSILVATAHAAAPATPHISFIVQLDEWVRLVGGIAGALAGFASATWYLYSFINARRKK